MAGSGQGSGRCSLRDAGIEAPVLVLGYNSPEHFRKFWKSVWPRRFLTGRWPLIWLREACKAGVKAKVHLKVDTGMGRLGWLAGAGACEEILELANPTWSWKASLLTFAASDCP